MGSACAPVLLPLICPSKRGPVRITGWKGLFRNMPDSYIQNLFATRIGGNQYGKSQAIYKFEKIKRAKRAAMANHPAGEIIDLGVGEPDEMAFPAVVEQL